MGLQHSRELHSAPVECFLMTELKALFHARAELCLCSAEMDGSGVSSGALFGSNPSFSPAVTWRRP